MHRIFLTCPVILILSVYVLSGQGLRFENISTDQGLSSPKIHHLFQDRQGFLWISTHDGLNRYDGHQFKVFRSMPDDPHSLAENNISYFYEDPGGSQWIGGSRGFYRYDKTTEHVIAYPTQSGTPGKMAGYAPMGIQSDQQGQLWISTFSTGLHRFDPRKVWFEPFYADSSWRNNPSTTYTSNICLSRDKQHLWVVVELPNEANLYKIDPLSLKYQAFPFENHIPHNHCWSVMEDRQGNVWMGTMLGLWKLNPQLRLCQLVQASKGLPEDLRRCNVTSVLEDPTGSLWIATMNKGLYVYHPKREYTDHYQHDPADPGSLPTNHLFSMLLDRSGVLWIGSTDKGLSKVVPDKIKFQSIRDANSLYPNTIITAIAQSPKGITWLGSPAGLLSWDRNTGALRRIKELLPQFPELSHYTYSILEDRAGKLWVGSNGLGLFCLNSNRDACTAYQNKPSEPGSLINNYVRCLHEDRSGTLWVGTFNGLDRYDPATDKFIHYQHDPKQSNSLPDNYVLSIEHDAAGRIWVGTNTGVSRLDQASGRFEGYQCPNPEQQNCTTVNDLYPSQNGMWAATTTGLYHFLPPAEGQQNWVHRHYTQKDGLPHNEIRALRSDPSGRQLWLGTKLGLTVLKNPGHAPTVRPEFQTFGLSSGLLSPEFLDGAAETNSRGELLFGNLQGINYFHPDSLRNNPFPPPLVIVGFEKLDANHPESPFLPEKGIADRDHVVLSYKSNVFTIEFAALDFREPEKNRFAYRMLGFNDQWIQLGAQHQVTFTNLDPGEYTFQLKGANNDGIWNETPCSLRITITPPWWKTAWAYALYALLFVAAITGFVRMRLRFLQNRTRMLEKAVLQGTAQIQAQKEQLEIQAGELLELDRLKSRFYANITHELRTPLTLILGPLNSVLKNGHLPHQDLNLLHMARENGQKLLKLIREILDLGKLDAGKLQVDEKAVLIRPLSARLVTQFDSYAQYLGIRLRVHLEAIPPDLCVLLDEYKFETIVNNLISNALKFTPPGGQVDVFLKQPGTELLLQVKDSGRGIHPDDLPHIFDRYFQTKQTDTPVEGGTGIGLALCAELARLLGGRIWAESTLGAGSTLSVAWPLRQTQPPAATISAKADHNDTPPPGQTDALPGTADTLPPAKAQGTNPPPRVLVVEDNPDLQKYLDFLLSPLYEVVMAGNGLEALEALEGVQLILSDIMMPQMDGFALLEHLKNDDRYRHIPVILLTARADREDRLRALRTGVDDYLTKPFEAEELLARVENLLQHQQNRLPKEDAATQPVLSKVDADWLAGLEQWTRSKLADEFLSVSALAHEAALSERQLQRRLRETTGLSPQQYIAELRLQAAREGLEQGAFRTVAEVAYAIGFGHAKAFSRAYRTRFGRLPSSYF